jgi:hypothetical protein
LVVQEGLTIKFFDASKQTISQNPKNFSISLQDYIAPGNAEPEKEIVQFAQGKGYLFIVGKSIEPLLCKYDNVTDTISVTNIYIQIRDFRGVNDGLANDEEPFTLSDLHHYNLRNQGWVDSGSRSSVNTVTYFDFWGNVGQMQAPVSTPIQTYFTKIGRYPGNNKQWWISRASTDADGFKVGDFNPTLLEKTFTGSSRAPRGHYVINAFYKDRSSVSGVPNIPVEVIQKRPKSVAFFSGRAWYVCEDTVYFSQVLDDSAKAGFCYQEADPTSEEISDLIATDGGVVPIPEMIDGCRLIAMGSGVIVFAQNGVWFISGSSNGFSALDITVSKLSSVGTNSPLSVVDTDGTVFWWSDVGIQAFAQKTGMFGPIEGSFDKQNISEETIQTYYFSEIPASSKPFVKGIFDPSTNTIHWMYKKIDVAGNYFYNTFLNLDLTLQAFYPWSISGDTSYITGAFLTPLLNNLEEDKDIVVSGVPVKNNGIDVFVTDTTPDFRPSFVKFVVAKKENTFYNFTFAACNDNTFIDWGEYPYESFLETGYELLDDALRKKQTPYVSIFFRRTEEQFIDDEEDFKGDRESSCKFQVKWDWSSSQISNKWSTEVEGYRHRRVVVKDENSTVFDTGYPIVSTRHRVRGSGRAIQFRFGSSAVNKDFDLIGWAVSYTGNSQP